MERRQVIGGGLAAGIAGLSSVADAEAAGQTQGGDRSVADAVDRLRVLVDTHLDRSEPGSLDEAALVREQQRIFMRANYKYPDFIEAGLDVWESVYFWHVKHLQPLATGRLADGRLTIAFMYTTVILRPDAAPGYVSLGFDGSPIR
jgi:hypothetical protein